MTLGENIARLRTARGLSQGALAEALEVSRQSVSKWETDASVPELDKLIRLSKLFDVTLDELVMGESFVPPVPQETPVQQVIVVEKPREARKTVGLVFVALAICCLLTGNVFLMVLAAPPFLAIGLTCLLVGWHPGLCSLWVVGFIADTYLRFATGLNWRTVRWTLMWTPEMNYMRLFVAWAQFVGMAGIILISIALLRKETRFPRGLKAVAAVLPVIGIAARFLLLPIMVSDYILRFWTSFIEWAVMMLIVAGILKLMKKMKSAE